MNGSSSLGKGAAMEESHLEDYRGYKGLPPLAGLLSVQRAAEGGLTVEEGVARLKRIHWALKRSHEILTSRITATPIYELKMAFSLHAHYCIEHLGEFRNRVREMRQPPYGLDEAPDSNLDMFFDEIQCAPTVEALVAGVYGKAIPALVDALKKMMEETNKLFDNPSYRICRLTLVEMEDVLVYGKKAVECLVTDADARAHSEWAGTLDKMPAAAGGLDGTQRPSDEQPGRVFSRTPFVYDGFPQRDERFIDSYNMGVNAEAMLHDPAVDPLPKTLMLYFKRMREIDVPEMMASIITETPDKPYEYYRDMTRQLWDEARHAMMGELGFAALGIDWTAIPLNFTWSLGLNKKLTPIQRHAVLFIIEQGLMPKKTGKQYEWEVALASANPLTALIQDYDWADEILHAKIGRDWLVPQIGTQAEAQAVGDKAWSSVTSDWQKWLDQGLTQHRNWWPEIYELACARWGVEPSAKLRSYGVNYAQHRADLKTIQAADAQGAASGA